MRSAAIFSSASFSSCSHKTCRDVDTWTNTLAARPNTHTTKKKTKDCHFTAATTSFINVMVCVLHLPASALDLVMPFEIRLKNQHENSSAIGHFETPSRKMAILSFDLVFRAPQLEESNYCRDVHKIISNCVAPLSILG